MSKQIDTLPGSPREQLAKYPELLQDLDFQVALGGSALRTTTPAAEASAYRNMASDWREVMLDAKDAEAKASDNSESDQ